MIHLALQVAALLFLIAVGCAAVLLIGFIGLILYAIVKKKLAGENTEGNEEQNDESG
jgi:hypothetical protein